MHVCVLHLVMPILASYMEGCVPIGILWREEGRGGDRGGRREGEGGEGRGEERGEGGEGREVEGEARGGREERELYTSMCVSSTYSHINMFSSLQYSNQ